MTHQTSTENAPQVETPTETQPTTPATETPKVDVTGTQPTTPATETPEPPKAEKPKKSATKPEKPEVQAPQPPAALKPDLPDAHEAQAAVTAERTYEVLRAIRLNGVRHLEGQTLDLLPEDAAAFVSSGNLRELAAKVARSTPTGDGTYLVVRSFRLNGVRHLEGQELEWSAAQAEAYVEKGNLRLLD